MCSILFAIKTTGQGRDSATKMIDHKQPGTARALRIPPIVRYRKVKGNERPELCCRQRPEDTLSNMTCEKKLECRCCEPAGRGFK